MAGYNVNHLDIAPRYAGVLMGITNTAGTLPGIFGPYVAGWITNDQVCDRCYFERATGDRVNCIGDLWVDR